MTAWDFLCSGDQNIQKFKMPFINGWAYTSLMKLVEIGSYIWRAVIFSWTFFIAILLPKDLHKSGTFAVWIITRSKKFLPQTFWWRFEVGKKIYFWKGPVLAVAFHKKVTSSCAFHPYSQQGGRFSTYLCELWLTQSCRRALPMHRGDFMKLTCHMLYCTCHHPHHHHLSWVRPW